MLIYVKEHIQVKVLPPCPDLEILALSLYNGSSRICLTVFYRPPNSSAQIFSQVSTYFHSLCITDFSNFIFLGDFNVNIRDSNHPCYRSLHDTILLYSLTQVVNDITHIHHNGTTSTIDLVLMSNPSQLTQCNTIPPLANSDHNGILLLTSWKAAGGPSYRRRTIWRYNHANWEGACELINDFDWDSIVSDDVNSSWMKWQHQFLSIMEQCIPQRSLPPRKNLPWMNKNLKQAMRRRNALYKNGKRTGNFSKFKAARNRVVNLLHESKKNYFTKINPRDTKKFWKTIKSLNKTSQSIPTLSHNGVTTNEDTEKANMLNSFFSTCFNTSHPPLSEHDQMPFVTNECPDELLCTVEEVQSLLGSLDTTKATGPDGVSAIMLKRTAPSIAPAVTKLFNLSLRSGQVPTDWKKSSVVPIPKSSDRSSPTNYRPISLLSILSKTLERHIHSLIATHLMNNQLLSNRQWGFLPGKGTVTALLSTTHSWFQFLENNKDVCAVFLDYRKAFDSVPHRPLLEKMSQLSINEKIIQWVSSYLSNRQQSVVLNGATSDPANVLSGVPQGSVLGPLLFIIYVNDLASIQLSQGSEIILYADDLLLFRPISTITDYTALQNDIFALEQWTTNNSLQFNASKCNYMFISRRKNPTVPANQLVLSNVPLERVDVFKYLGLLLTADLSWTRHIETICARAKRIVGMLYRQYYHNVGYNTMRCLYLSLVRPHLEYACSVWDPHTQGSIDALEKVQKFALRMVTKSWDAGCDELNNLVNLPTLQHRRLQLNLCQLYKIIHGLSYFPDNIFIPRQNYYSCRSSNNMAFVRPFAHTNAFLYSYVPHTIKSWNSLSPTLVNAVSLSSFKHLL